MNMKEMIPGDDRPLPGEVRELFHSYRESFPEMDGGASFMPGLWAKIDGRRRIVHSFGRLAGAFVTAAFVICLLLSGTLLTLNNPPAGASQSSYIDVLADDTADDEVEFQLASAETL
jgi:hypothetical protein